MNIAKLASTDLPLFNGIIQDLFPAVDTPVIDYGKVSWARAKSQAQAFVFSLHDSNPILSDKYQ